MIRGNGRLTAILVAIGFAAAVVVAMAWLVLSQLGYFRTSSWPDVSTAVEERPDLGPWGREEVTRMAAQVPLAEVDVSSVMPPAMELARQHVRSGQESAAGGVRIVTGFEGSVPLEVEKLAEDHLSVRIRTDGMRNWFMFRVEGVPPDGQIVRIDLEEVNLGKWRSLNPVYSYVQSLGDLSSFTPATTTELPIVVHNGPMLPNTRGQAWQYIEGVWSEGTSRLSFVHQFKEDAFVAMRVPYTPSYNEAFLASVAGDRYAQVLTVGQSSQGRPLQLVKVSAGEEAERTNPCILMYAREFPSSQDPSWAIEGLIRFLASDDPEADRLRQRFTFILLPVLDPDGAAEGVHERITYLFTPGHSSPEVLAYAAWFEQWVDQGKRLDIALNLHNIESAESEHLSCPYGDPGRMNASEDLHAAIVRRFRSGNGLEYRVQPRIGGGYMTNRLCGWLGYFYGPLPMLYVLNSQDQKRHLSLDETREMGRRLALACADYLESEQAKLFLAGIDHLRRGRAERLETLPAGNDPLERAHRLQWNILIASGEQAPE
jgi:hypothetical protein